MANLFAYGGNVRAPHATVGFRSGVGHPSGMRFPFVPIMSSINSRIRSVPGVRDREIRLPAEYVLTQSVSLVSSEPRIRTEPSGSDVLSQTRFRKLPYGYLVG